MFYYAIIDDSNVCYDLYPSDTQITDQYYVEITQQQFEEQSVVNMQWNPVTQEWQTPFYFIGTTDEVNYQGSSLTSKLNSIDEAIEGKADEVHTHSQNEITGLDTALSGKANTSDLHSHNNKTVLDGISAEKVNAWDNKAESNHSHSQYATTESVNEALSGKADSTHTHSQYLTAEDIDEIGSGYVHPDTHPATMITGLSDVATTGSYNDLSDKPTIPVIPASLPANGGNADTVDGKHSTDFATANHNHAQSDISGLESALSGKANATHSHTEYASNADVEALETAVNGKANASHTHSNYASVEDVENLQTTVNGKADATHSHTEYSAANHTHSQYASNADVEALETEVSGKAEASHTHSNYVTNETYTSGMSGKSDTSHTHTLDGITDTSTYVKMTAAERTKLSGVATGANKTVVDSALSATSTNPVQNMVINSALAGKANSIHTHTLDDVSETTDKKILTATERTKLSGIAEGANKTTVDSSLSSSSTNPVQNKVVNTALNNKVDKVSGKGLSTNDYTTDEKNKLAGIAEGANAYTHPSYTAKSSGLYKVAVDNTGHISGATAVSKADITGLGIPAQDTTYSNATTSTAGLLSASDKSKLDGIATGANKTTVDTALSSSSTNPVQNKVINSALAGKASTSHNHDSDYIAKALQCTSDTGNVEYSFNADSGKNILTEINSWEIGLHTAYAIGGTAGNPNTTDSFRFVVHKTSANIGWVVAFGSNGSIFTNYVHNGTFGGWKCIYEANATLWTGIRYMNETHTITPSKKLSECRNGWMLEFADYDSDTGTANDYQYVHLPIYKRNVNGNWQGQAMLFQIPTYINDEGTTVLHTIKQIRVHDDKLVGHAVNDQGTQQVDTVLRAVYEF